MQRIGTKHVGRVTYSAHGSSLNALASLPLERIFACVSTGKLFPPWQASLRKVNLSEDVSHKESLRTFYCSVCIKDVKLLVDKDHLGVCGVCGWEASKGGIGRYDDLLTKTKNPFPEIDERIRNITKALDGQVEYVGQTLPNNNNILSESKLPSSDEELRGYHKLAPANEAEDGAREQQQQLPDMVVLDGRISRERIPPRRKLVFPKPEVLSPFNLKPIPHSVWSCGSSWGTGVNASRFLPHFVDVLVYHGCSELDSADSSEASYSVRCVNPNATGIYVRIDERAKIHLDPHGSDCITFQQPFKHDIVIADADKEPGQCSRVFDFHCEVDFETPAQIQDAVTDKKWAYRVFIWHDRKAWTDIADPLRG